MSLRSRCAIAIAVSALVTTAATAATAVPAVADDDWGQGQSNNAQQNQNSDPGQHQSGNSQQNQNDNPGQHQNSNWEQNQSSDSAGQNQNGNWEQNQSDAAGQNQSGDWEQNQSSDWGHSDNQRFTKGIVTASSLALRSAPTRGSQVIRYASRGEILSIFCKTRGEDVQGDPVWYQIADDIWAWGAARYIDTIGRTPRWC